MGQKGQILNSLRIVQKWLKENHLDLLDLPEYFLIAQETSQVLLFHWGSLPVIPSIN